METEVSVDGTDRTNVSVRCNFFGETVDDSGFQPTSCNHAILPLNARYQFAELDIGVSFSLQPDGTHAQVGPNETTGEFITRIRRKSDIFYTADLRTSSGTSVMTLDLLEEALPEEIIEQEEGTAYVTLDIRYDEARTKEKHDLTDEEIEARRDAFRDETREHMEYGYEAVIGDES